MRVCVKKRYKGLCICIFFCTFARYLCNCGNTRLGDNENSVDFELNI